MSLFKKTELTEKAANTHSVARTAQRVHGFGSAEHRPYLQEAARAEREARDAGATWAELDAARANYTN
ncbi:hypothetical protein [Streptomyces rhizosphaericus]|uniref:Uncharacterized protein n=1 Tax=Streptomyces rhizosphaericus TaxID=114699 RepID=A0A6G4AT68_9ACTN|nr:hypothetical protein [Streptomyces rhizosphaericus]NEW76448.1 hypothetical protein [Streptomyces rhizosphaericus]